MVEQLSPVGWTAVMVAAARAAETRRVDRMCADGWARHFVSAAAQPVAEPTAATPAAQQQAWAGLVTYQAVRTRVFDQYCYEAAEHGGCRQIVLLAAGLDARAQRLSWPDGTTAFELDRAELLEFKHQVLTSHPSQGGATRCAVPVDLRHDWPTALIEAGFDPTVPTAWLAEGLLPFLDPATCNRLLEGLTRLSAPGSRLALEWFDTTITDAPAQQHLSALLDLSPDELWAGGPDTPPQEWLHQHGWNASTLDPAERALAWHRPVPTMLNPATGGQTHAHLLLTAARPPADGLT